MSMVEGEEASFSEDLLEGAHEVGEFLFKDRGYTPEQWTRKVYWLMEKSNPPFAKMGSQIVARRSVVKKWFADQEARNMAKETGRRKRKEKVGEGSDTQTDLDDK